MAGIIWQIIRENQDGTETVVEEFNNATIARSRLSKLNAEDGENYYYLETR